MKIAFVHDWIVFEGGAEAVCKDLIQSHTFDDGKIFVLFSLYDTWSINKNIQLPIITALPSWLNSVFIFFHHHHIPILSKIFDYRNLMFWFPVLCWLLRKKIETYSANEVIISSFAAVKNVVPDSDKRSLDSNALDSKGHNNKPKVTLYLHSPMQYIWENYEENIKKFSFPIKQLYQFATIYLRPRDKQKRFYDTVLANSHYTAGLAKKLYNIDAIVSYPCIDNAFSHEPISLDPKPYLVFVGRVQKYVREIGLVIEACNQTNTPLIVIGDGPDMGYAKKIAGNQIIFVGDIRDVSEKITIMKDATGLINLAKESFGIGTAEALCLGLPVLGFNGGATPELVDNTNGILVDKHNVVSGIETLFSKQFDRQIIATQAREKFFNK